MEGRCVLVLLLLSSSVPQGFNETDDGSGFDFEDLSSDVMLLPNTSIFTSMESVPVTLSMLSSTITLSTSLEPFPSSSPFPVSSTEFVSSSPSLSVSSTTSASSTSISSSSASSSNTSSSSSMISSSTSTSISSSSSDTSSSSSMISSSTSTSISSSSSDTSSSSSMISSSTSTSISSSSASSSDTSSPSSMISSSTSTSSTSTSSTSNSSVVSTTRSSIPTRSTTSTISSPLSSTPSVSVITSSSQQNDNTAVAIGLGLAICIAFLICVIVIPFTVFLLIKRRRRSKKYVLPSLALENSESVILLKDMSNCMPDQEKKLDKLFAHIPKIQALPLTNLEKYVAYLHEGENEDNAAEEFESLLIHPREASCAVSQTRPNAPKNRYINILPFDDTRVLLNSKMDYINANYIAGYSNLKEYVAAQGPLSNTIDDFWQMVWETGCDTIVMVTNPVEAGNPKCEVYWPEEGHAFQCSNVSVSHTKEMVKPSCTTRELMLSAIPQKKNKSSTRLVSSRGCKQFHFTSWPDMGVPMDIATMIRFIKQVRSNVVSSENPIIIHCSAGVGRTGTFIALDVLMQRMKKEEDINIKEMVLRMRAQRPNMVQTVAQYMFIYDCLLHEYLYGETEVTKENIKDHFDKLLENFPDTEDSRLEKEYEGANQIILPDTSLLEATTSPENAHKNRRGAGIPLDLNRVHLNDPFGSGNDYINASYIGVFGRKAEFIITQHPLPDTREDFWRMMLERNFGSVVVLGPVKEEDAYWSEEKPAQYGEVVVRLVDSDESDHVKVIITEVECEEMDECITVKLFQLLDWPVNDVPDSASGILELSDLLREHSKGLAVVHTAASVSDQCSGVFCVIHSLGVKLADGQTIDVMGSCKRALQQRQGCISSKEQYQFIYEAILGKL